MVGGCFGQGLNPKTYYTILDNNIDRPQVMQPVVMAVLRGSTSVQALTVRTLLCRQFSEASYREFRQHTLEEAAMVAARNGSFAKVQLLCERHPHRMLPGMLTLLACVPETASHEVYLKLLSMVSLPLPSQCLPK